MLFFR